MRPAADPFVRLWPHPGEERIWPVAIAYAAIGLVLLVGTTIFIPVDRAIALPVDEWWATVGGVVFFVGVTALASSWSSTLRGGIVITVSFAPIVVASILGGPTAGAWVAFLGVTERREFTKRVPLYGILATHSMAVIAAVVGGLLAIAMRGALPPIDGSPLALVLIIAVAGGVAGGTVEVISYTFASVRVRRPVSALIRDGWPETPVSVVGENVVAMIMALLFATAWWSVLLCLVPLAALRLATERYTLGWLADHDPLTGVALRRGFTARLDEAHASAAAGKHGSGLLMLDLDRFKVINDTYGHETGDRVLWEVASRLTASARAGDTVARLGGDEFAMILAGISSRDVLQARATALVEAVSGTVDIDGTPLKIEVSAGGVVIAAGCSPCNDCLALADAAMFAAKASGGGFRLAAMP